MSGFDHDQIVRLRAGEPVNIGGTTLHPAPQNWEAIRALKRAGRQARRAGDRSERLEDKAQEIEKAAEDDEAKLAEADRLYEEADEHQRQALLATCAVIAAQLIDGEGKSPDGQFIFDHIDFHQIPKLADYLAGSSSNGDGAEENPTK